LYDLEGVLGPSVIAFVENHVGSLLAWDILVYFHRNPDVMLDASELASRLGRRIEEIQPEITVMCAGRILSCTDGQICFQPADDIREDVTEFVHACQDRDRRLALIALVLHRIGRPLSEA